MNVQLCIKRESLMAQYKEHSHPDRYEIITNYVGVCTVTVNGQKYEIGKNDILIVPPNVRHGASSAEGFMDFFIAAKYLSYGQAYIVNDTDNAILPLMELLYKVMLEKEANYSAIADSLLATVCTYIDKYIDVNHQYPFVNSLKNTILEHFIDPYFDLAHEIDKSGYNKDYLRRCFEGATGKTPLHYLTELRINRAKMLLLQNEHKRISSISELCGFRDSYYFSTVFKKYTGISPEEYRRANTN